MFRTSQSPASPTKIRRSLHWWERRSQRGGLHRRAMPISAEFLDSKVQRIAVAVRHDDSDPPRWGHRNEPDAVERDAPLVPKPATPRTLAARSASDVATVIIRTSPSMTRTTRPALVPNRTTAVRTGGSKRSRTSAFTRRASTAAIDAHRTIKRKLALAGTHGEHGPPHQRRCVPLEPAAKSGHWFATHKSTHAVLQAETSEQLLRLDGELHRQFAESPPCRSR